MPLCFVVLVWDMLTILMTSFIYSSSTPSQPTRFQCMPTPTVIDEYRFNDVSYILLEDDTIEKITWGLFSQKVDRYYVRYSCSFL